jgi:hypothetical protein
MNYQNIYNQIIERAKGRKLEGYKERHHIIPKCLGGDNSKENLVDLTAREHYICHRLLCKIYPNNNSLSSALWLMINASREYQKRHKPSSRIYELLKEEYALRQSLNKTGVKREKWVCEKLSKSMKGIKRSDETKKNISKAKTGSKNHMFGITGYNNKRSKPIEQYDLEGNFIKEWPNGLIVSKELNIRYVGVNNCCLGRIKTSGGFRWNFK